MTHYLQDWVDTAHVLSPKPRPHPNLHIHRAQQARPPLPRHKAEVSQVQFPIIECRSKSTQNLRLPALSWVESRPRKLSMHLEKIGAKL